MDSLAIPQHPVSTTDKPFSSLGLSDPILGIIQKIGFQNPTPIQAAVIPLHKARPTVITATRERRSARPGTG